MAIKIRKAAVDIGNDAVKAYLGDLNTELTIPNVIVSAPQQRKFIDYEKDPLKGLHVEITSGALKPGKGTYFVGQFAARDNNNDELKSTHKKSESDQSLILLLTTLAIDAAQNFPEKKGVIEATYYLSTGLPILEILDGKRGEFKNKLEQYHHEVRFLQTPVYEGKLVRIKFEDVLVNTEGSAALLDLTTHDDGSVRNEELVNSKVLINDIGGLSTDAAVIDPEGAIDNRASRGMRQGVSTYLDEIIKAVNSDTEIGGVFNIQSRKQLVEIITKNNGQIKVRGSLHNISDIVDDILMRLAREEFKFLEDIWNDVSDIDYGYMIGGGATILRPLLEKINKEQKFPLPLRFVPEKESVWMIARAYFKLLIIYLEQREEEVAVTEESDE